MTTAAPTQKEKSMAHELPKLPYAFDALEPHIDARTMEIHHGKHHATYVTNLNAALDKHPDLHKKSLDELMTGINSIPEDIRGAVRNNGGGHWNHSFFWKLMKKGGGGDPTGDLAKAVDAFGGLAALKEKVTAGGLARFGSGWVWVVVKGGKLEVSSTPNQDNPLMDGGKAILGIDVWEHAYYLKYQNVRKSYLDAWWNVVNWDEVAANFAKAK
jgi:superoxide dismutase, Fe-Mn family